MPEHKRLIPRLVIAAPQGRSGKTTVTLGLCAAFKARGLNVQPFKKGPDYIDPSWLSEAAGCPCRSLDPFFYDQPEALLRAFVHPGRKADLSFIEGNHGLFDSFDETGLGSTAAVARTLDAPILLVVNATRVGRSAAAIVHGCQTFEPGTKIAGVVLNNVAHGRHETRIRQAIESHCHIPVVGAIPRDEKLTIPDRHLGLVPRAEQNAPLAAITACREAIERHLDLDSVLGIAQSATPLPVPGQEQIAGSVPRSPRAKIGVLRDRSFTFYYPENLEALQEAGGELVFIDAFTDTELPPVDALYIGGGFPEMFMDELSENSALRRAVREAIEDDLPAYAECGGLMYLSRRIVWGEKSAEMVGVLPCEVEMTARPQGHGYVIAQVENENPFFAPGTLLRGHEFHNSRLVAISVNGRKKSLSAAYRLSRGNGLGNGRDGIVYRNVLASYTHLHSGGAPNWATGLVRRAQHYRESRQQVKL
ncbi:MAG: hydrogenobyrinic acid a,c-diamide synthase (glutamine-hydrolyzing) [Anaerolineales bacterium]|nr:hydrogenobyrinic acid a,c-diamide synthase (glutamine-hydrolyzing) [Anaerolineales bacterium]